MSETDLHRTLMLELLHALEECFRKQPRVYVSGNIFVYYLDENGKRQAPVSPDIFVVFGVEKKKRRIYRLEKEGKAPDFVLELTSSSTRIEDLVTKRYIYAQLGVREYFVFDPEAASKRLALQGFRLAQGEYVPMTGAERLPSEVLGLALGVEKGRLRFYTIKTGERLRTPEEAETDLRVAEAEADRLRKELAKLRRAQPKKR